MTKKRQNIAQWLIFMAIFSLQTGCASLQTSKPANDKAQASSAKQKKLADKPVKNASVKSKQPTIKNEIRKQVKSTVKKSPKEGLSGEVFYYLFSAEIAAQRGQIGLAAALYTKAALATRDPRVAQQATRAAYYARDDKRAILAAQLWNELEPENVEARQVLAALLVRIGKTEEAAEHFEFVLKNGKYSERQGFTLITSLLSKEKDKRAALAVMEKLIEKRKNNPNALYAYSQLAFLVGNLDEALNRIKKVIKLQPEWTEAYILQSNIFVRQGYKLHALKVLKLTLEDQSDNTNLRMFYARSLVDAKQFNEAINQFELLTDDEKLQHEARYALGLLTLQMNKPK